MEPQRIHKPIVVFEKDALGRVVKYDVEMIEDTGGSRPVRLKYSGGAAMMLPRKKYGDIRRFMKSKHDCMVITVDWNGRIKSRCYSEGDYRKLLEVISSP